MKQLFITSFLLWLSASVAAQQTRSVADKLSPALRTRPVTLTKDHEQVLWIISTQADSTRSWLSRLSTPAEIIREYPAAHLMVIRARAGIIDSLLLLPHIQYIDAPRVPKEEQAVHAQDFSVNNISSMQHNFPAANGNGLVVSVKENRPDTADIDFKGRFLVTPLMPTELTTHATIMATTIAGGGNSFYTGKGIAWKATITSSSFASILPDVDADYRKYNISVQNHSYGTTLENYYGADAVAYDASVRSNPGLLHVFSAGNSGNLRNSTGTYAGLDSTANLTGSFKMAKNILTVGAVDSFNNVAPLSSKGPAYDGRIKPELVAFGQDGSSGAAAIVSGIALALQHAYKDQYLQLPDAALIKAILINSAEDIDIPGPDFRSGYGTVNAWKAMQTLQQQQYYNGTATNAQQQTFALTVPAGIRSLKITLCWNDIPASANAAKALVNDLDLQLINTTTNETWMPWVLSGYPKRDSLLLPATRKRDSLNTVEQITVQNPVAGNYQVRVNGYNIATGPQDFYIAIQQDTADRFAWRYPTSSDYLTGGQQNILRWSNTFSNTTGTLYYSIDKGNTWQLISNTTDLAKGYASWQAPDTSVSAIFRMSINGNNYFTDTCIVSKPTTLRVGFNCTDSVLLYWPSVSGAVAYALYQLGTNYLEPLTTITDTAIILHTTNKSSLHYTVAPVIKTGKQGIKALTVNYTTQGAGCYINNLFGELTDNNTAALTLTLGSLYQVSGIALEKFTNNRFTSLYNFQPGNNLLYQYTDNALHKGGNIYRARITLANGSIVYSAPETVYSFDNSGYLVFPNPVNSGQQLQIRSNDLHPRTVLLYNSVGQCIKQVSMNNAILQLSLADCARGIYWLVIVKEGKVSFKTTIIRS